MSAVQSPVSDMLVTVKSRELQRAMLAEMRGDRAVASRHFLAAGHLELVLADDYEQAGETELALRSRLSAGSCFWRGGQQEEASQLFESLANANPTQATEIKQLIAEIAADFPALAS